MSPLDGEVVVESVRIATTTGRVRVIAEDRDDVEVDGRATVVTDAGRTTVESVSDALVVRVPIGCDVVVGTVSGKVETQGPLGELAIVAVSGRVSVEQARSADIRTGSARIEVGRVDGELRAHTKSGRITAEASGASDVSTMSGQITLSEVSGRVHAHCISGRIEVRLVGAHDVEAETVSGRVSVELPAGTRPHLPDDPAEVRPPDCDCTVVARSVSGRVTVT